ncbi:MAG: hypothetical protein WD897_02005 [Parcubacteria group bacterium]
MKSINMGTILKEVWNSPTFRLRKNPPSFLEGVASAIDISPELTDKYNTDQTEGEADAKALASDWSAVSLDMNSAIKTYGEGNRA